MCSSFTEGLEQVDNHLLNNGEAEDQKGEAMQEELPQPRRGPKKRVNKNSRKQVTFLWSWALERRLGHYIVERNYKEHRDVDRSEVVEQAVDEFLTREEYKRVSKNS